MLYINPHQKNCGSFIPNWLLERTEISDGAKILYSRLSQHFNKITSQCNPKLTTLAKEIGKKSTDSIERYVKELISFGLIESIRTGKKQSNTYRFLNHPWMDCGVTYEGSDTADLRSHDTADLRSHPPSTLYYEKNQYKTNMSSSPSATLDDKSFFKEVVREFDQFNSNIEMVKNLTTRKQAIFLLAMLNVKCKKNFRCEESNLKVIEARLKSGASVIDAKRIINHKKTAWEKDQKMSSYLRPATLFGKEKFEQYLGEFSHSQKEEE